MLTRIVTILLGLSVLFGAATVSAQVFDGAARKLLHDRQQQPNDLARYIYLLQAMPGLSARNRLLAAQFVSFSQCELGLYTQAVLGFPLSIDTPTNLALPHPKQWRAVPAAQTITAMARDRRIVMPSWPTTAAACTCARVITDCAPAISSAGRSRRRR